MKSILRKIFSTPKNVVPKQKITAEQSNVIALGNDISKKIGKLFGGCLTIRQVAAGSDNSCEQELVALTNAFYDIERFGIKFVASPRHADVLMVCGPVARNMKSALIAAYNATPNPKIVIALGDGAIDGGIWQGSYATEDGVHNVIPVDYQIPGDPPSPTEVLRALLAILKDLEGKTRLEPKPTIGTPKPKLPPNKKGKK